jgi:type IV pilus assembly protein PilV
MRPSAPRRAERGATLIEILVTIVIVAFGLLGLAGLQMRMQMSEAESYQRSQALMLVNDMATRIANNRLNTAAYISSNVLGAGFNCGSMSTSTQAALDLKEWCQALEGASETSGSAKTGGMINGKGCIETSTAGDGDIVVTVVWQGLTPISAPPTSVSCGLNQYNGGTGATCTDDKCRRFVTTIVRIGSLT